jgi:predicted nucleotidyltransferase
VLRAALQPLLSIIELAFVYGSLAKGSEHGGSDIDLMVIGTVPSHAALLQVLAPASSQLGRVITPTLYTPVEFTQRVADGKSFIVRVLAQPKIFVKGSDHDVSRLGAAGEFGAHRKTQG